MMPATPCPAHSPVVWGRLALGRPLEIFLLLNSFAVLLAAAAPALGDDQTAFPKDDQALTVTLGRSVTLHAPWPVTRVSVTDPKIADVKGLTPDSVMIVSKAIGSTDLMMWNEKEEMRQMRIDVVADLEWLRQELGRLFPKGALHVAQSHELIVVTGTLNRAEHAEQLHRFLEAQKLKYVDMTSVSGVQQVQIQVRVAEVSRTALRTLGINGTYTGRASAIGQAVAPSNGVPLNPISIGVPSGASATAIPALQFLGAPSIAPGVTLFGGFPDIRLQLFVQALAENQYLRILAEPTLMALSGEDASFLAGGEIPIPVPQNSGTSVTITVEYKEYGVRLKFHPTVLGDDRIRLTVSPEVSELSDQGAVVIQGFNIPSLLTRRAQTTMELKNGQTFAMAGLISHNATARNSRVPGLGDLPVLGALFRSVRYENDETELVVLVTASLVEPLSLKSPPPLPGDTHAAPNDWEFYAMGAIEGQAPAKLSRDQAAWLHSSGLNRLRGPGGWAPYDRPMDRQGPSASDAAPTPTTRPVSPTTQPVRRATLAQ